MRYHEANNKTAGPTGLCSALLARQLGLSVCIFGMLIMVISSF